jgi:cysteine synthase
MGYKSTVFVPKTCSQEKLDHIRVFGATVFVEEPNSYISKAKKYANEHDCHFIDQYNDPLNPDAYYSTLGPELWEETKGSLTHFVMAGSTCGCICGTSKFLKEMNPSLSTILVETTSSCFYEYYYRRCTDEPVAECSQGTARNNATASVSEPSLGVSCSSADHESGSVVVAVPPLK